MLKNILIIFSIFFSCHLSVIAEENKKFTVGLIAPLSGALAEYGVATKNSIELAIKDQPELFTNIEFIMEDSEWDPRKAVSIFNDLVNIKKVDLVYNWGNPTSEALASLAESRKQPMIAMSSDPKITKDRKYIIRTINSVEDFSKVLVPHLVKKQAKKIGVVIVENSYVQGLYDGLVKNLPKEISLEIVNSHQMSDQDFRSTISKIKTKKYDYLGVFLISGQISTFYKQLAAQAVSIPTFGADFFESKSEIDMANGGMENAVYPNLGLTDAFRVRYQEIFKNDSQITFAGNSYDMATLIGHLFNDQTMPVAAEDLMKKLQSISEQNGVGGKFTYINNLTDGPYYKYPVQLKVIKGGKVVELKD